MLISRISLSRQSSQSKGETLPQNKFAEHITSRACCFQASGAEKVGTPFVNFKSSFTVRTSVGRAARSTKLRGRLWRHNGDSAGGDRGHAFHCSVKIPTQHSITDTTLVYTRF